MGAEAKALELGLEFPDNTERAYLNMAARTGKLIITSGHTSTQKGKLGQDVTVAQGYEAAKEVIPWRPGPQRQGSQTHRTGCAANR